MKPDFYSEALQSLKPNAKWSLDCTVTGINSDNPNDRSNVKNTYKLIWLDSDQTEPTQSEIDAEITKLETAYTNNEYQRKRAGEYPSVVDQLDDIYHNGIDAWKATIKATKDKYPKS